MRRAVLLLLIGSWFLISVIVGALMLRGETHGRTDLLGHPGARGAMVTVYCDQRVLDVYVITSTWGLRRDGRVIEFGGLAYRQSSYAFQFTIPAWAWFSATLAAPAALLVWRWRRRKSAESRRGFAVRTDRTTTASAATSA